MLSLSLQHVQFIVHFNVHFLFIDLHNIPKCTHTSSNSATLTTFQCIVHFNVHFLFIDLHDTHVPKCTQASHITNSAFKMVMCSPRSIWYWSAIDQVYLGPYSEILTTCQCIVHFYVHFLFKDLHDIPKCTKTSHLTNSPFTSFTYTSLQATLTAMSLHCPF